MNEIPQHTLHLVERLLAAYCERICPPTVRHAVQLRHRVDADRATLYHLRSLCGIVGAARPVEVAQFRYRGATQDWRFLINTAPTDAALDAPGDGEPRWRRYAPRPEARTFIELLREFDADPAGLFWGRFNGKSLRWCRSEGRCGACDERYCRVLGTQNGARYLSMSTSSSVNT